MSSVRGPHRSAQISGRAQRVIDELNQRYERSGITGSFVPRARRALIELEGSPTIPDACVESVVRVIDTLVAGSGGTLETHHGGQYLLHMWQRSDALSRLLGGALELEMRFALIELATLVCIEHSWIGCPPDGFEPLQPQWRMVLNAVTNTKMIRDPHAQRWREIIAEVRDRPVEGARQFLTCALVRSGMVDVERGELRDEDFARAAGKSLRWFNVSHGSGLRLLGQLSLIWDRTTTRSPVLGASSANLVVRPGGAS
jgi:hypothetical protein